MKTIEIKYKVGDIITYYSSRYGITTLKIIEAQYTSKVRIGDVIRYKGIPQYPARSNRWNTPVWIKQNSSSIMSVEEI